MSNQAPDSATKPRPSGQLKLLAIIGVVILPIVAAYVMAKLGVGIPDSQTNRSNLVEPAITVEDWGASIEPLGYGAPWRLVVTAAEDCDRSCLDLIHEARQINVALGREAGRVEHHLWLARDASEELQQSLARDYPRLGQASIQTTPYRSSLANHPEDWRQGAQLWVVDPLGRVVLRQDPDKPGKQMLDDLKHLLKVSKIG